MTPPADLVLVKMGETLVKQTDTEGERIKGWVVRVFQNKNPVVTLNAPAVLRGVPALQRARHRLPLRRRRDPQPRRRVREAGHRPVDQPPRDDAGQGTVALRPEGRELRRHVHQPRQGFGRVDRPPARQHRDAAAAPARRRAGGGDGAELPQRARGLSDVPGHSLRERRSEADNLDRVLHRVHPVGLRPLATSSGSTRSATRRAS